VVKGGVVAQGRRGGSMVACQTVVLQSRVQIWHLPSPQLTANLLVGCHLGWHLAPGWPLWGATEEKITKINLWLAKKNIKINKKLLIYIGRSKCSNFICILYCIGTVSSKILDITLQGRGWGVQGQIVFISFSKIASSVLWIFLYHLTSLWY
jgi:hypothetical protein